jgi:hypothetical protein
VRYGAERDHHCVKASGLARAQERPESNRAGLNEVSHKETEAVPHYCNRDARAQTPWIVPARKNDDSNINERLQYVKKPKLGNGDRGYRQRYKEKHSSHRNPEASRCGSKCLSFVHSGLDSRAAWPVSKTLFGNAALGAREFESRPQLPGVVREHFGKH